MLRERGVLKSTEGSGAGGQSMDAIDDHIDDLERKLGLKKGKTAKAAKQRLERELAEDGLGSSAAGPNARLLSRSSAPVHAAWPLHSSLAALHAPLDAARLAPTRRGAACCWRWAVGRWAVGPWAVALQGRRGPRGLASLPSACSGWRLTTYDTCCSLLATSC